MAVDGRTVITDFGIARFIGGSTPLTVPGSVLGTPAYMAPEMISGGETTAATDLWSLGATLYAALEGHPPFEGDSITEICVAIVSRPVPAAPNAGALADLLNRLLVKEPAQRATAPEATALLMQQRRPPTQLTMDTQLAAATAPTLTRTAPLTAHAVDPIRSDASRRKQRRRKAIGGAILISAVLVAGILVLSLWDNGSSQKTGTAAASSPTPTHAAATPSPTAGSPTPATPAGVAPTTSPTDAVTAWESGGGASKLAAVQNDLTLASEAAAAGHGAALLGWCGQLTSDEAAAEKYRPIPDNVAQLHWADALYDAFRAANYCADWENGSGQDQAMLNAATANFDQATAELQTVTTRLHQLGG
jgi:Protein kinase domain